MLIPYCSLSCADGHPGTTGNPLPTSGGHAGSSTTCVFLRRAREGRLRDTLANIRVTSPELRARGERSGHLSEESGAVVGRRRQRNRAVTGPGPSTPAAARQGGTDLAVGVRGSSRGGRRWPAPGRAAARWQRSTSSPGTCRRCRPLDAATERLHRVAAALGPRTRRSLLAAATICAPLPGEGLAPLADLEARHANDAQGRRGHRSRQRSAS